MALNLQNTNVESKGIYSLPLANPYTTVILADRSLQEFTSSQDRTLNIRIPFNLQLAIAENPTGVEL
jgi:hypothetical protein